MVDRWWYMEYSGILAPELLFFSLLDETVTVPCNGFSLTESQSYGS